MGRLSNMAVNDNGGLSALLVYEYCITFDCEVRYGWVRKFSWARAVFFFNRYLSLLQSATLLYTLYTLFPASYTVSHRYFALASVFDPFLPSGRRMSILLGYPLHVI